MSKFTVKRNDKGFDRDIWIFCLAMIISPANQSVMVTSWTLNKSWYKKSGPVKGIGDEICVRATNAKRSIITAQDTHADKVEVNKNSEGKSTRGKIKVSIYLD